MVPGQGHLSGREIVSILRDKDFARTRETFSHLPNRITGREDFRGASASSNLLILRGITRNREQQRYASLFFGDIDRLIRQVPLQ
jgi:hypothetical protein